MTPADLDERPAARRIIARRSAWGTTRTAVRWVRRVAVLLVAAALLTVGATAARVWQFARVDQRQAADAIVVLGAAQFDGRPSEVFEARLRHAQALYLAGYASHVVTVGGGRQGDRVTEAEAGKAWLVAKGLPRADVVAVPTGTDTLLSLRAAAKVYDDNGWRSALVVTDPWHELRSTRIVADLGLTAYSSPTRSGPSVHERSTQLRYIARETAAYLYYRIFGHSVERGPRAV